MDLRSTNLAELQVGCGETAGDGQFVQNTAETSGSIHLGSNRGDDRSPRQTLVDDTQAVDVDFEELEGVSLAHSNGLRLPTAAESVVYDDYRSLQFEAKTKAEHEKKRE